MFQLNPALRDFWATRKPYKLLKGGRFSGKTQDAGGMAAYLARNFTVKFLCIRQFQNRIGDSVYTVIKEKIETAGWVDEFDIGVSSIRHRETGSEFLFYGIARNLNDIKGTEGVDICWIEEGEGLTEDQWAIIDPTIRKQGSEIWLIWNPNLETDFVQTKLPKLLGDKCIIRHINYTENPFLSESAREKAERLKAIDIDSYNHIYLGIPRSSSDCAVIPRAWVQSAIDAHKALGIEVSGDRFGGLDVADEGDDKNAFAGRYGILLNCLREWSGKGGDIYRTVERAFEICDEMGIESFAYDADGLGSGVRGDSRVINEKRSKQIEVVKFQGSGAVTNPEKRIPSFYSESSRDKNERKNKDMFANFKAQAWWSLRMRFLRTHRAVTGVTQVDDPDLLISISSDLKDLDRLCTELSQPVFSNNLAGKIVIDKQPNDTDSPNLADAVNIVYAPSLKKSSFF